MKKLLSVIFVLTIVSLIGSLVGCSSTTTSITTSNTASLQEQTVLIGTDSPLTGGAAPWGLSMQHGVQLAADDVNAAGGLTIGNIHYTFKVVSLDDKYDTASATNNVRQLVYQNGSHFIFTFVAEASLALASELTDQKVIQFTVGSDDRLIAQPENAYTFRTFVPPTMFMPAYWQWIVQQHPNAKTVDWISTNNDNGLQINIATKTACAANGLNLINSVLYGMGTKDFTPFVTKIVADNPDIVNMNGTPTGDAALIIKTLYSMGYKGIICQSINAASDETPIAGAAAMEGTIDANLPYQAPYVPPVVLGLPDREVAKWGAAYGNTWDFYSEATILFTAMQRAKSVDPATVKNILQDPTQKWPYAALAGKFSTFGSSAAKQLYGANATNQINSPWPFCIVHNGQDYITAIIEP